MPPMGKTLKPGLRSRMPQPKLPAAPKFRAIMAKWRRQGRLDDSWSSSQLSSPSLDIESQGLAGDQDVPDGHDTWACDVEITVPEEPQAQSPAGPVTGAYRSDVGGTGGRCSEPVTPSGTGGGLWGDEVFERREGPFSESFPSSRRSPSSPWGTGPEDPERTTRSQGTSPMGEEEEDDKVPSLALVLVAVGGFILGGIAMSSLGAGYMFSFPLFADTVIYHI